MSGVKISALPVLSLLDGTEQLEVSRDGVSSRLTSAQVASEAFREIYTAPLITAGVLTIDLALGTVFNVTNDANITTFTVTGATAGRAGSFTMFITANGSSFTQAWGSSVSWADAVPPTLTTTVGQIDVLTFVTNDGGTTWFGFVAGQNF